MSITTTARFTPPVLHHANSDVSPSPPSFLSACSRLELVRLYSGSRLVEVARSCSCSERKSDGRVRSRRGLGRRGRCTARGSAPAAGEWAECCAAGTQASWEVHSEAMERNDSTKDNTNQLEPDITTNFEPFSHCRRRKAAWRVGSATIVRSREQVTCQPRLFAPSAFPSSSPVRVLSVDVHSQATAVLAVRYRMLLRRILLRDRHGKSSPSVTLILAMMMTMTKKQDMAMLFAICCARASDLTKAPHCRRF